MVCGSLRWSAVIRLTRYNPSLSPILHNRKFHRGKVPNVKALAIPWHCGDIQKVIALHLSLAIPRLFPVGGGGGVDTNDWCICWNQEVFNLHVGIQIYKSLTTFWSGMKPKVPSPSCRAERRSAQFFQN